MAGDVEMTINWDAVHANFEHWANIALEEALLVMEAKAKDRAPVRDIFKHDGWRKSPERVPRGVMRTRAGEVVGRRIRHHRDSTRNRFMRATKSQSMNNREAYIPTFDAKGKKTGTRRVRGNPTTWDPMSSGPLLRRADGRYTTGRFRDVDINPVTGKLQSSQTDTYTEGAKRIGVGSGATYMSAKGRAEMRRVQELIDKVPLSQRDAAVRRVASMSVSERQARYERLNMPEHRRRPATALFMNPGGQLTLGGRLRGEIYRTGVTNEGDVYSGEVVSPTEYAKYQEYGTSNNRAHPYMRPALYDMRTRFPQIVKKTMRRRPA